MTRFAQHMTDLHEALENQSTKQLESILKNSPLLESNFNLDDHQLKNYFTLLRELRDINKDVIDSFFIELAVKTKFKESIREFSSSKPDLMHIFNTCSSNLRRHTFLYKHHLSVAIPNTDELTPRKH